MTTSRSILLVLTLLVVFHLKSAYGDFLTRTYCHCGANRDAFHIPNPGEKDVFYFRFAYYNTHLDHFFVMDSFDNFVKRRTGHCKRFARIPGEETKRNYHQFCYHFARHTRDTYKFDRQTRAVPKFWGQMNVEPKNVVGDICTPICEENYGLSMVRMTSQVDTVYDQADMCEGCA